MAYVQVPKDLTKVKNKVMFNLTKRQLICFGLEALIGIPTYFLTKNLVGTTVAACLMVILMLPFFFFAMYEKDGMPWREFSTISGASRCSVRASAFIRQVTFMKRFRKKSVTGR